MLAVPLYEMTKFVFHNNKKLIAAVINTVAYGSLEYQHSSDPTVKQNGLAQPEEHIYNNAES